LWSHPVGGAVARSTAPNGRNNWEGTTPPTGQGSATSNTMNRPLASKLRRPWFGRYRAK
jgi:hypothetical protein